MSQDPDQLAAVDFALLAYREENVWRIEEIDDDRLGDLDALTEELRRWPGDFGTIALLSIDEDFFIVARVAGTDERWLLSDATAALEWDLAEEVLEELDLPLPQDEEDQVPAGDLAIFADLGMPAMDLSALLDDYDLYPEEILSRIAEKLGFGALYDDAVGAPAS